MVWFLHRAGFLKHRASSVITVSAGVSLVYQSFLVGPQTEGKVPHFLTREMWVGVFTWIQCKISTVFNLDYLHRMVSCNVTLIRSSSKHSDLAKKINAATHSIEWGAQTAARKLRSEDKWTCANECTVWPSALLLGKFCLAVGAASSTEMIVTFITWVLLAI